MFEYFPVLFCISACHVAEAGILVVPEDLYTGLYNLYGFVPRFLTGLDSRFGYGFRLGNHADFQVLYEFGPQTATKPLRQTQASWPLESLTNGQANGQWYAQTNGQSYGQTNGQLEQANGQTGYGRLELRSASYRTKTFRRRPLVEFLLKAGLLREAETQYDFQVVHN